MARRTSILWSAQRRSAVELAELLVRSKSQQLPTDLLQIARHRRVHQVHFTPLLTDGALAVTRDGFVIYVRCEPEEREALNAAFAEDGKGGKLPANVVRRARFTIAHEIAHTLFFDLKPSPPRSKIPATENNLSVKLELACNQIAGLILLPEDLLCSRLLESPLIRPHDLRQLADEALVSGQTVTRRLSRLRKIDHPKSIIATVTKGEGEWKITAISRHYALDEIFKKGCVGNSARHLIRDPDFVLFGGEMRDVKGGYIGHGGVRKEIEFTCEVGPRLRRGREVFVLGTPVPE